MKQLDHLVLIVKNIAKTIKFYEEVLEIDTYQFTTSSGEIRYALKLNAQKINLQQLDKPWQPHAFNRQVGSSDLCFLSKKPLDYWITKLDKLQIKILLGPISRTGATGKLNSIYTHDPDKNLIEIANLIQELKISNAVNKFCPNSGKAIQKDSLTIYKGKVVGFCNPDCRDAFANAIKTFDTHIEN